MVATGVGVLIAGTTMLLLLASAKESRRGLADAVVEQAASDLEHKLMRTLRVMSANEGIVFGSPSTNSSGTVVGYNSIIIAAGPSPDNPRQQIAFDPASGSVTYKTNYASPNSMLVLAATNANSTIRLLTFQPSVKPDGTPDNSLVNVLLQVDDNGSAGRFGANRSNNPAVVWRSFAVKMRNN